ncbi:hypothetical protein QFZ40_003603 [Arthrobacter pascens]|uniref:hypothetical protein n=1 Tax=Arthrobacter pascens TaxID=1677 RepID=UPI00278848B6|nr:hypothetical protein [Arthrobacter pascens]MDQ0635694.1 hypothetical protein [Arthrobacter pascens]
MNEHPERDTETPDADRQHADQPGTDRQDTNQPDVDSGSAGPSSETRATERRAAEPFSKPRPAYVDPGGSQATRDLRDTARRRRDAEEKLQQHLMEAKEQAHHQDDHPDADHDHGLDTDERGSSSRPGDGAS